MIMVDNDFVIQRRDNMPRRIRLDFAFLVNGNDAFIVNRAMRAVNVPYCARVGNEFTPVCYGIDFVFGAPCESFQDTTREVRFFLTVRAKILPTDAQFASVRHL